MKTFVLRLGLSCLLASLCACGGGGGGQSSTATPTPTQAQGVATTGSVSVVTAH